MRPRDHVVNALILLAGLALCVLALSACGEPPAGGAAKGTATELQTEREASLPDAPSEHLAIGRAVFLEDCTRCHTRGNEGAPKIVDGDDWRPRLAKGREVLHRRAITGFIADSGAEMPERGGNRELSDLQVTAAADFMIWIATGEAPGDPPPSVPTPDSQEQR